MLCSLVLPIRAVWKWGCQDGSKQWLEDRGLRVWVLWINGELHNLGGTVLWPLYFDAFKPGGLHEKLAVSAFAWRREGQENRSQDLPDAYWLLAKYLKLKSKSRTHCDWRSVSHSVLVSSPIWGSHPDISSCLKITVFSFWGAFSDEKTGLSFVRVTVSSNKSVVSMYNVFTFSCY
jgi:hypothetical protein